MSDRLYISVLDAIGNTPLVALDRITKDIDAGSLPSSTT